MSSVITITPAPSIDRTYYLDSLEPGSVHRATRVTQEFAGKGVNVSHALHLGGTDVRALVPAPESERDLWGAREWIGVVPSGAHTRVSITVLEPDGRTTKINQSPPALDSSTWARLLEEASMEGSSAKCLFLAVCGALPALSDGSDLDLVEAKRLASSFPSRFVMDTSGPHLGRWARQGVPDVIKPNAFELAECVGRSLVTLGDVIDAAEEIRSWGVGTVLVSLGAEGMVGVETGTVYARAEPVQVVSTIGAGDASLAGFLAFTVKTPGDFAGAVGNAVAWGSAKVAQEGSQMSSLRDLPRVTVTDSLDRKKALDEPARISTAG